MTDERRIHRRYRIFFPMRFDDRSGEEVVAVSHNVSQSGLLMATATRLDVDAPITVVFRVTPTDPEEHRISARIVRVEENAEDPHGLWPLRVAVEFEEPARTLEQLLEELGEKELGEKELSSS